MGSTMDSQCTALYEGLLAGLVVARVRSLIGMYPIMTLEVGLAIEALSSNIVVSIQSCSVASTSKWRLGEESHTLEQPSCHSHRKGRAAMSTADAAPLAAVCLTAVSAMRADSKRWRCQQQRRVNEIQDTALGQAIAKGKGYE